MVNNQSRRCVSLSRTGRHANHSDQADAEPSSTCSGRRAFCISGCPSVSRAHSLVADVAPIQRRYFPRHLYGILAANGEGFMYMLELKPLMAAFGAPQAIEQFRDDAHIRVPVGRAAARAAASNATDGNLQTWPRTPHNYASRAADGWCIFRLRLSNFRAAICRAIIDDRPSVQ